MSILVVKILMKSPFYFLLYESLQELRTALHGTKFSTIYWATYWRIFLVLKEVEIFLPRKIRRPKKSCRVLSQSKKNFALTKRASPAGDRWKAAQDDLLEHVEAIKNRASVRFRQSSNRLGCFGCFGRKVRTQTNKMNRTTELVFKREHRELTGTGSLELMNNTYSISDTKSTKPLKPMKS